jgi:hypothetical protein
MWSRLLLSLQQLPLRINILKRKSSGLNRSALLSRFSMSFSHVFNSLRNSNLFFHPLTMCAYVWMRLLIIRPDFFSSFSVILMPTPRQSQFCCATLNKAVYLWKWLSLMSFSRDFIFSNMIFFALFALIHWKVDDDAQLDPIINFNKSLPQMAFHFYLRRFNSGQSHLMCIKSVAVVQMTKGWRERLTEHRQHFKTLNIKLR